MMSPKFSAADFESVSSADSKASPSFYDLLQALAVAYQRDVGLATGRVQSDAVVPEHLLLPSVVNQEEWQQLHSSESVPERRKLQELQTQEKQQQLQEQQQAQFQKHQHQLQQRPEDDDRRQAIRAAVQKMASDQPAASMVVAQEAEKDLSNLVMPFHVETTLVVNITNEGQSSGRERVLCKQESDELRQAFDLRSSWAAPSRKRRRQLTTTSRQRATKELEAVADENATVAIDNSWLAMFVLHPGSNVRLAWDLFSIGLLLFDLMVIPIQMAFNPPSSASVSFMAWLTLLFWTGDIFVSMLTGFIDGKAAILVPSKIVARYLRTWFLFDLLVVGIDWALMLATGDSAAGLGRFLRALRILRAFRMVRIVKLKQLLQSIQDLINTEAVSLVFGILKNVFGLFVANHIIGCGWFAMSSSIDGSSWVTNYKVIDRPFGYQYMTSLHWSLTQFTPASMEVFPQNMEERCFAVSVLLFALVAFSSFVSALTASITQLRSLSSKEAREFWLLRRYLRDWGVRKSLNLRVQRYLEYANKMRQKRVQAGQVHLLTLLPKPLYDELKYDTFSSQLSVHPLFSRLRQNVQSLGSSLESFCVSAGELLFSCGMDGTKVYFPLGMCSYAVASGDDIGGATLGEESRDFGTWTSSQSDDTDKSPLSPIVLNNAWHHVGIGDWIGEPALWTNWSHVGDFQAQVECQVISVDCILFEEAVRRSKGFWMGMQQYAKAFVDNLNSIPPDDLTDLSQHLFAPETLVSVSTFARCESDEEGDVRQSQESTWISALPSKLFGGTSRVTCAEENRGP
eukprot:TRINITY_DN20977_c0_g2_i1.p1 TRINITY_DN20977_c0_g2~~TRINITY_DN20977_c0_g2_i1.p1  ORF type:complete len:797 (+),score=128.95 TRINITY_DN20977_c0_g2_i1:80-2470(+)